ncbi:hypothetical protein BC830DRAFT_286011 [Chytriomyces sp. MP71]|nr:hypothetical protein BC830DRAFT_286011 [Chytriomyces sp. MP71]
MMHAVLPTDVKPTAWHRIKAWLRPVLHSKPFHLTMIYLVLFDLVLVVIDLILSLYASCVPGEEGTCVTELKESDALIAGKAFLFWLSVSILFIFVIEIFLSVAVFGFKHLKNPIVGFDALVILTAVVTELYFHYSGLEETGSNAVIILRILKIVRGMHAVAHAAAFQARERVHELEKINKHIGDRARTMTRALSVAHQQVEALFESLNPMDSKEAILVRGQISQIYEHLKSVVQSGEIGLEEEIDTLLIKEGADEQDLRVRSGSVGSERTAEEDYSLNAKGMKFQTA